MTDSLTKEEQAACPHGHQLRRKCLTCDHEDACNDIAELTDQIIQLRTEREELRRDVARWVNAHRVAMVERDQYKQVALINAQTISDMTAARRRSEGIEE